MKTHVWKNVPGSEMSDHSLPVRKIRFKEIAKAVKFTSNLFGKALSKRIKATILFATETGKSELYAKRLAQIFSHAFNVSVSFLLLYTTSPSSTRDATLRAIVHLFLMESFYLQTIICTSHSFHGIFSVHQFQLHVHIYRSTYLLIRPLFMRQSL